MLMRFEPGAIFLVTEDSADRDGASGVLDGLSDADAEVEEPPNRGFSVRPSSGFEGARSTAE